MDQFKNVNAFFEDLFVRLECERHTKAYLIQLFSQFKSSEFDLSQESLTLYFAQAKFQQNFLRFQTLADWILFSNVMHPNYLTTCSKDYYHNLGRNSYYSCYRLINRQWPVFEELSDNFIILEQNLRIIFSKMFEPVYF